MTDPASGQLQGKLQKLGEKGPSIFRTYSERFFYQQDDKLYYAAEGDSRPRGFIDLCKISDVFAVAEQDASGRWGFVVRCPSRDYHLLARSAKDRKYWMRGLQERIKLYGAMPGSVDEMRELSTIFELSDQETLIARYTCGCLDQKERIFHGELYITPSFLCFLGKQFGKEKKFVLPRASVQSLKIVETSSCKGIEISADPYGKIVLVSFVNEKDIFDLQANVFNSPKSSDRSLESANLDHMYAQVLQLPASEFLVAKYKCVLEPAQSGTLCIFPGYVGFIPRRTDTGGTRATLEVSETSNQVALAFVDVVSIEKKGLLFSHSVRISSSSDMYIFSKLHEVDEVLQVLENQWHHARLKAGMKAVTAKEHDEDSLSHLLSEQNCKEQELFHQLLSLPDHEMLLKTFHTHLAFDGRKIPGRVYISQNYISFHPEDPGNTTWELMEKILLIDQTKKAVAFIRHTRSDDNLDHHNERLKLEQQILRIPFQEITSISKSGSSEIQLVTKTDKHMFTFLSRDAVVSTLDGSGLVPSSSDRRERAYDYIIHFWNKQAMRVPKWCTVDLLTWAESVWMSFAEDSFERG